MQKDTQEEDIINLKHIFTNVKDNWYWFIIGICFCLIVSFLYIKFTPPIYQTTAKLLVNDDEKGGGVAKQANALMDLGGIMGGRNSVDNESEILKTRFLMEQVVRSLNLDVSYSEKKSFFKEEIYNSPFSIKIHKAVDTVTTTTFSVKLSDDNHLDISGKGFEKRVKWNQSFLVDGVGNISIARNLNVPFSSNTYYAKIYSFDQRVSELMKDLSVAVSNKQVSIINLTLNQKLPKFGEEILNELIRKYIQSNLNDKNAVADSTYYFIKQRLNVIATELGDVEDKVEVFKQRNKLSDMSEQGKLLVQNTGEFALELAKVETQINVLSNLERYIKDNSNRVFPSSLIAQDMVFSNLMSQYNTLLLEREKQLLSVTESSPFVQNIDNQIEGLKKDILSNIITTRNSSVITRNKLRSQLSNAEGKVSGVPEIEKNYLKLARNQQIKQELYIFLMQKAEETSISKTSNISVAKVIDPPKADMSAVSPRKGVIYIGGLIGGLFLPVLFIFLNSLLSTSIKTRSDVNTLTQVPVIGEISHSKTLDNLIVANHGRSAISEQYRALRTNLSFYLKNRDEKVILMTSSMSGEGKSFTAINLGNVLALAGKKVLLMELDLRKPGLSGKLGVINDIGFSNFTVNDNLSISDIIKPLVINDNMSLITSGPIPPNPAETLMSPKTALLIEKLKEMFDYIILDAPPIGVIADAQILSNFADATIYLVRQKFTNKDQLKIVEDLYINKKMKNIGIVVNDIVDKYYGDGYEYGAYGEVVESNFITKLKNKLKIK